LHHRASGPIIRTPLNPKQPVFRTKPTVPDLQVDPAKDLRQGETDQGFRPFHLLRVGGWEWRTPLLAVAGSPDRLPTPDRTLQIENQRIDHP
jgi:hypothetical protein